MKINRKNKSDRLALYKEKMLELKKMRHIIGYNRFVFSVASTTPKKDIQGASL